MKGSKEKARAAGCYEYVTKRTVLQSGNDTD